MKCHSKITICLVDDTVDLAYLQQILPYLPPIHCHGSVPPVKSSFEQQAVAHGTVCMGLLCEFLQRRHLLDVVELYSISLLNADGEQTVDMLEQALGWCFSHSIDLICLSAGFYRYLPARHLIQSIRRYRRSILVAAQSNEGTVTYPASLSCVIGTRYARELSPGLFRFMRRPMDGIEIATSLPESKVLQALGYQAFTANSFTPPYVAAQLVDAWRKKQVTWNRRALRNFLARSSAPQEILQHSFPRSADLPPVVLFYYRRTDEKSVRRFVKKLQRLFLHNGYDCVVLDDALRTQNIEAHRFCFTQGSSQILLERIVFLTDPSIILVLTQGGALGELLPLGIGNVLVASHKVLKVQAAAPCDAVKVKEFDRSPVRFYHWLLCHFSEN